MPTQRHLALGALVALLSLAALSEGASAQSDDGQRTALSAAEAKELGSKQLGSVGGKYSVPPVGIYTDIDMSSLALLKELRGPTNENVINQIKIIKEHGGNYNPAILMQTAIVEYDSGNNRDAIFWLHAGLIRTILDVKLCTDRSVGDAPKIMLMRAPPDLVKAAFADDAQTFVIVQQVVDWDARTPMHYDHRWIALHGVQAVTSALDPAHAPTTLILPQTEWPEVIAANRKSYPEIVAKNVARLAASKK